MARLRLEALLYLCSGVVLNVVSQLITDTRFSDPQAHIIPFVKFTATLAGAALRRPKVSTASREQQWLMGLIGLLDASAYTVYCVGFAAVGATLANLLLSGVGQVLTAALTRWVLHKRLTNGQLGGIAFVFLGLAVRAAPSAYFAGGSAVAAAAAGAAAGGAAADSKAAAAGDLLSGLSREQAVGCACVALAALLYSLLGVAYEKLLKGSTPPPPNGEIMWNVSILGFLASTAYQALYTLPNWGRLVGGHLEAAAARGHTPRYVAGLLALFGLLFNLHMMAQAHVFKSEGAIGVGLVNACRGAVISVVVSLLFCDAARQHLCLTRQTALSALITTVGGAVYVLANGQRWKPPAAPAVAEVAAAARQAEGHTAAAAAATGEGKPAAVAKDKDA